MLTYTTQLKAAVKAARKQDPRLIGRELVEGTNFWVVVKSVHIRPSGGACRAFGYLYSLEKSDGTRVLGEMDRADSFVSVANQWLRKYHEVK